MKENTARIGDDGRTDTIGVEMKAFRAVGRKSTKTIKIERFAKINTRTLKKTN